MKKGDDTDPKGLIAEAYRIDGITKPECRSIFLDWALALNADADQQAMIAALLSRHGEDGHPMTAVLREGQAQVAAPRRRGGYKARDRSGRS